MQVIQVGKNLVDLKRTNRYAVLNLIYHAQGISRKEIAGALGLTPATITGITNDLLRSGLVQEHQAMQNTHAGRPEIRLTLCNDAFVVAGVSIRREQLSLVLADLYGNVLWADGCPITQEKGNTKRILGKLLQLIQSAQEQALQAGRKLVAAGVSIRGNVDIKNGISRDSYGILEPDTDVAGFLQLQLGILVQLSNNVCASAHAECFFTHNTQAGNLLFIKYGPGIGAAHLIESSIYGELNYGQAELGHTIAVPHGAPCPCGGNGCLETVAGFDAIVRQAMQISPEFNNIHAVLNAWQQGNREIERIVRQAVAYFSLGIKNAAELLQPETVILYGEVFEDSCFLSFMQRQLTQLRCHTAVRVSAYNGKLSALGPASGAVHHFFRLGGNLPK